MQLQKQIYVLEYVGYLHVHRALHYGKVLLQFLVQPRIVLSLKPKYQIYIIKKSKLYCWPKY